MCISFHFTQGLVISVIWLLSIHRRIGIMWPEEDLQNPISAAEPTEETIVFRILKVGPIPIPGTARTGFIIFCSDGIQIYREEKPESRNWDWSALEMGEQFEPSKSLARTSPAHLFGEHLNLRGAPRDVHPPRAPQCTVYFTEHSRGPNWMKPCTWLLVKCKASPISTFRALIGQSDNDFLQSGLSAPSPTPHYKWFLLIGSLCSVGVEIDRGELSLLQAS